MTQESQSVGPDFHTVVDAVHRIIRLVEAQRKRPISITLGIEHYRTILIGPPERYLSLSVVSEPTGKEEPMLLLGLPVEVSTACKNHYLMQVNYEDLP